MSASEATFWLWHFIACVADGEDLTRLVQTHGAYMGWSVPWSVVQSSRKASDWPPPYTQCQVSGNVQQRILHFAVWEILILYRQIRELQFNPDLSALDRIIHAADLGIEGQQPAQGQDSSERLDEPVCVDSDSSVASEHDYPIDDHAEFENTGRRGGLSDFPCIHLMVRRVSKVMHLINEDDTFACGRNSSRNYQALSDLQVPASSFEPCQQCLKAVTVPDEILDALAD